MKPAPPYNTGGGLCAPGTVGPKDVVVEQYLSAAHNLGGSKASSYHAPPRCVRELTPTRDLARMLRDKRMQLVGDSVMSQLSMGLVCSLHRGG